MILTLSIIELKFSSNFFLLLCEIENVKIFKIIKRKIIGMKLESIRKKIIEYIKEEIKIRYLKTENILIE